MSNDQIPSFALRIWRWRGWLALALLIGGMVGFRLGWGWWVGRQIDAKLAVIRGRGEAGELRELTYTKVPVAENAWPIWMKAYNALTPGVDSPRSSNLEFDSPPYPATWMNLAAGSEKVNAQMFMLARMARGKSVAQFRTAAPAPNAWMPYLNGAKWLANTLADGAEYAQFTGNSDEAVERELDLLNLGGSVRQDDFVVSQLVSIGVESLGCASIQSIAPELMEGPPQERAGREKKIRQLIEVLLDERLARQGTQQSLAMERMIEMEQFRQRSERAWVIRPLGERQIARMMDIYELAGEAARCEDFAQARAVFKRMKMDTLDWATSAGRVQLARKTTPRYSRWFLLEAMNPEVWLEREFRVIAERRLTAMNLACQIYRARNGKWPAKLEDLVPGFAKEVAKDPFDGNGAQIGYRVIRGGLPGGGDRPVLYFDPGGEDLGVKAEAMYWWDSRPRRNPERPVRQYRDMARYIAVKGSAKAVDGNPDQADAPGEKKQVEKKGEKP